MSVQTTHYYVYTSISYAIPFMSMGYLIAKHESKLQEFHHWGILYALGVALAYGERALLFHAGYDYAAGALFGSFVTAVLIFIWALQHKSFGAGDVG